MFTTAFLNPTISTADREVPGSNPGVPYIFISIIFNPSVGLISSGGGVELDIF